MLLGAGEPSPSADEHAALSGIDLACNRLATDRTRQVIPVLEQRIARIAIFTPWPARRLQALPGLFIRHQVRDLELVRRLTPNYVIGCKRILIPNKWYPMFNRSNVELIDDDIAEIREATRRGRELPADCIVYNINFFGTADV